MLLKDLDLCMITYTWNDVSQITLEVVFKTSTLTCLFNQNDICEAVYLFLTDNKDLMKYISHCVKTYTYDSFWMAGPRINATFQYAVPKIKGVFY